MKKGKIIRNIGGIYSVLTEEGDVLNCSAKGLFRYDGCSPTVGDDAFVSVDPEPRLDSIGERRNSLIRPPISNVSTMFIVFAAAEPEPVLLNIDKLTCIAEHNGITPVIVISKKDIAPEKADLLKKIYDRVGYKTFTVSSDDGAEKEIREYIRENCRDGITCFAGASGVGKSTLMTKLFPSLDLQIGEISRKISRGKNTTRKVELYLLNDLFGDALGGYVADTPGFSLIDFVHFDFFDREVLPNLFPEFENSIGKCRFTKCTHLCEDGCAVCAGVSDGSVPKTRHESYVSMYNEMKNKRNWSKQK